MGPTRKVMIAVFDGVELLSVTGPAEVFAAASRVLAAYGDGPDVVGYAVELVGRRAGPVAAAGGVRLVADASFADAIGAVDTVMVPGGLQIGPTGPQPLVIPEVVDWVTRVAPQARRVASVCAGAHMLAATGLLDGHAATTHWYTAGRLSAEFPRVNVEADPIVLRVGRVWTCAGGSAGMDLALAMVADDCGESIALAVARWLVMYLRRPGGQNQFSIPLSTHTPSQDKLGALQQWIGENLTADLSVPALAQRMHMSARHFARVFAQHSGATPAAYVEAARLQAARRMLEETDHPIETVAASCGYGSVETLYRSFRRRLATAPTDYRHRFRSPIAS